MPFNRRLLVCAAALFVTGASLAQADYPNRPIKVIVPFPAGGVTDIGSRIILDRMSQSLNVPVVVDNRPGAGTKLGTGVAVKSAKDGYTLYMSNSSYAILPVIDPEAGYDAERDLAPIGLGATYGMAVVVNPALSAKTMGELLTLAKQTPGKLAYGSAGMGSGSHFMGEHLKQLTGTNILHVPYKSTSLAVQDVAGGRVDLAFDGAVKPLVDAGKVRIIAVTGAVRDPRFPQVPTVAEAGLGDFTFESWLGLFAPTDTPERVIVRLNQSMNEALADPGVKQRLAELGLTPGGGNPAFLKKQVSADLVKYRKIAAETRIKLQ
ncbi:hypothetical protein CDO46_09200 [Pigmentiphaga sp. NML030171]|uniref:Tripartite tricarboxylate transporter substrate binding protein BugE n=1 Tax=Pigmentiphaga daeguensis TaxID=414049 RepID=A0ABN1D478_9BURK|nr:tripartite tricarboxylate transporter substrate binding protein [Pigmentiphaga sp. NML030171]OVZ64363.1 hypothetical protein CDO46_09200 [Pigmentiphaga sp. NML030171]